MSRAELRALEEEMQRQIALVASLRLDSLDLLDLEQYNRFKNNIENWKIFTDSDSKKYFSKVHQSLLELLPAAQQKQQLQKKPTRCKNCNLRQGAL